MSIKSDTIVKRARVIQRTVNDCAGGCQRGGRRNRRSRMSDAAVKANTVNKFEYKHQFFCIHS